MSTRGAQSAAGIATYRTARELGSRSPRSYAAVREPNGLVVTHRFTRSTDPRAKSAASFVSPDGGVSLASDAMASLARDARCLAKNWHPNIARVRHVDVDGDGLTVATEFVDGATLGDLFAAAAAQRAPGATAALAEPLLPLPVLVRILVDVITGLSGLHGLRDEQGAPLGTIHGALSPANVVVGKDGVARLLNALRPRPLRIAAGTEAVGYAAPETLDLGATQDVRADLHSVGVIMWEGLTGRRLYEETDSTRVLARQREEDVTPPAFPAGSPFTRLGDVTMRALAFDPSLRFKTAAEMGAALRNIAATRIATGSVVATQVAELAGERIRARRIELDPGTTGNRRLASERNLRAATPAARTVAASADHDTLPPGAMDPTDLGPPSSVPLDLSVRDFLEPAGSAPAIAAPKPPPKPPPKLAPKLPPPLIRRTANGASSASTKVAAPAPVAAAVPSQTTDRGLGPPALAAPALVIVEDAAAIEPPATSTVPLRVEAPNPVRPAAPAPAAVAVTVLDDVPAPAPPVAYMPVVHATPEAAFTPSSITPPRDRRPAIAILLGCALALLLLVGFFAVRAMVAGSGTTTAGPSAAGTTGTAGTTPTATAAPTGEATVATSAGAAEPSNGAKPEPPPAATTTATTTTEATNEAPPAAIAEPTPTVPAADPAAVAAPPAAAVTAPAAAPGTPVVARPPSSGAPRPKRPTYEPLGI